MRRRAGMFERRLASSHRRLTRGRLDRPGVRADVRVGRAGSQRPRDRLARQGHASGLEVRPCEGVLREDVVPLGRRLDRDGHRLGNLAIVIGEEAREVLRLRRVRPASRPRRARTAARPRRGGRAAPADRRCAPPDPASAPSWPVPGAAPAPRPAHRAPSAAARSRSSQTDDRGTHARRRCTPIRPRASGRGADRDRPPARGARQAPPDRQAASRRRRASSTRSRRSGCPAARARTRHGRTTAALGRSDIIVSNASNALS